MGTGAKIAIIGGIVVVLAGIAVFIVIKIKKDKNKGSSGNNNLPDETEIPQTPEELVKSTLPEGTLVRNIAKNNVPGVPPNVPQDEVIRQFAFFQRMNPTWSKTARMSGKWSDGTPYLIAFDNRAGFGNITGIKVIS